MPGNSANFRSGELNLLQEVVQAAVSQALSAQGNGYSQCREELEHIRSEMRSEFASVRVELGKGTLAFGLINQRIDWLKEERERERAEDKEVRAQEHQDKLERDRMDRIGAAPKSSDTSKFQRLMVLKDRVAGPALDKKRETLLISPKVLNAIILAMATALGGCLWGLIQNKIMPSADATPKAPAHSSIVAGPPVPP